MNIVVQLLILCAAPFVGAYLGKRILARRWLSTRLRVFLASLPVIGGCVWLAMSHPLVAIMLGLIGLFALREGRAYPVEQSNYGGLVEGPFGLYRPRVSDGATWGDIHRRDRTVIPWSQKSDLHEMQEGALGSLGSAAGKRFENYPPVIHRDRPKHARLVVNNGRFPPKGSTAKRGRLKSVK